MGGEKQGFWLYISFFIHFEYEGPEDNCLPWRSAKFFLRFFTCLSFIKAMFLFTKIRFKFSAIFSARACADVFPRCSTQPESQNFIAYIGSKFHKCNVDQKCISFEFCSCIINEFFKYIYNHFQKGCPLKSLSFTIYLEIVLSIKSTNQKHGGFDVPVSYFHGAIH